MPEETKVEYPKDLKCFLCDEKIHEPQNIEQFLGVEECQKYVDLCKELGQKPHIYCCRCFGPVQSEPSVYNRYQELVSEHRKFMGLFKKNQERSKELDKRESELNEQLEYVRKNKYKLEHIEETERELKQRLEVWDDRFKESKTCDELYQHDWDITKQICKRCGKTKESETKQIDLHRKYYEKLMNQLAPGPSVIEAYQAPNRRILP